MVSRNICATSCSSTKACHNIYLQTRTSASSSLPSWLSWLSAPCQMHTVLMQIGCVKTTSPLCATPRLSLNIPSRCPSSCTTVQPQPHKLRITPSTQSKHCMTEPTSSSRVHNTVSTTSFQGSSAHASTECPLAQSHFRFQPPPPRCVRLPVSSSTLHRTPCHPLHAHKRCSSVPPESSHDRHLLSQRQHVPYCVVCAHASRVSHTIACTLYHSSTCHCSTASQLTSPTRLCQLHNVMLLRPSAPKPRHRSLNQHLAQSLGRS